MSGASIGTRDAAPSGVYAALLALLRREPLSQPPPGWDPRDFLEAVRWHRLAEWCHVALGDTPWTPAPVRASLEEEHLRTSARSLVLDEALAEVLGPLHDRGIRVMLLKGAALSRTVYPDPGLRPMTDLDLLVPEDSLPDADRTVRAIGYDVAPSHADPDEARKLRTSHRHYPALVRHDGQVAIELHRRMSQRGPHAEPRDVWERATPLVVGGLHVSVPSVEDMIAHVAVHLGNSLRYQSRGALGRLLDLTLCIGSTDHVDWDRVRSRADAAESRRQLWIAAALAHRLLGAAVPAEVLEPPHGLDVGVLRSVERRRVLRHEDWLPLEHLRLSRRAVRRALPAPGYVQVREGAAGGGAFQAYARRAGRAARLLVRIVRRPQAAWADLRLNRRIW